MAMNRVPTLVLGLGGIGGHMLAVLSQMLSQEDRKYVALVAVDTDAKDMWKLKKYGILTVQISDNRKIRSIIQQYPEVTQWFPVSKFLVDRGMVNGAGQIRAMSRLALMVAEKTGVLGPILTEIDRIRSNHGEENHNLTVMVGGTMTGGSCSGMALQLPLYIREKMRDTSGLDSIIIRGMFIGPDITAPVQGSEINRDAVYVNAYAFMKELNAMYMAQVLQESENHIDLEFYPHRDVDEEQINAQQFRTNLAFSKAEDLFGDGVGIDRLLSGDQEEDAKVLAAPASTIPYDFLYLIEGRSSAGTAGNTALPNLEALVARMMHTLFFTPVEENQLSVEDNTAMHDMAHGGMNRYASAGICRLIFPQKQAQEYVTLCAVKQLVNDEWLLLDQQYQDRVADAQARQRTDGMVEIPRIEQSYISLFEEAVKAGGTMGKLNRQAYITTEDHQTKPRSVSFLRNIDTMIDELLDSDDAHAALNACEINETQLKKFADAKKEFVRVYTALADYRSYAKQLIAAQEGALGNQLFPISEESMRGAKRSSRCIYSLLADVHPLVARFLIYDMILRLEKRVAALEALVVSTNLDEYLEEDFDPKMPGKQTAFEALKNIEGKKIPVLGEIKSDARRISPISTKMKELAETQKEMITQYIRQSLDLASSQILLSRLRLLAENYQIFFNSICSMMQQNEDQIRNLEQVNLPLGQIGVYCSREAFRNMVTEYTSTRNQSELPADTKRAIFDQLFAVVSNDFNLMNKEQTEAAKERRAEEKRIILTNIFRTAVVDTMRTEVLKQGANIVNLTIRQALLKEMEETGAVKTYSTEEEYREAYQTYIRNKINTAMRAAAPMLSVETEDPEKPESVYLALHPACAEWQEGAPSEGATHDLYVPAANEATDQRTVKVLVDEAFSPTELICFKTKYKYLVEDLTQYRPEGIASQKYRKRIAMLCQHPANPYDPDSYKTVVTPHMNRYWHEQGFLPALFPKERKRERNNVLKAFIYAMGMDTFTLQVNEDMADAEGKGRLSWYVKVAGGMAPVTASGKLIGTSYVDLYQSLPFNGKVCQYILAQAKHLTKRMKGYSDVQELYNSIFSNWFILDLIQSTEDPDDENLLDIFLKMRERMDAAKWNELFTGLQLTLWEFTSTLFDNNRRMINTVVPQVLKLMYRYSTAGKKELAKERLSYGEERLKEQIELLLARPYQT